jgi:hypothetical protein
MTIPEKPELPDGAIASQAQNPDQALSDASLDNVTGGLCDQDHDCIVTDGSNVRPDSPDATDPLGRLRP